MDMRRAPINGGAGVIVATAHYFAIRQIFDSGLVPLS